MHSSLSLRKWDLEVFFAVWFVLSTYHVDTVIQIHKIFISSAFSRYLSSQLIPFFFLHSFPVVTVNYDNKGDFKLINSSGIVYPYLSTPIGKPILESIVLFCSLLILFCLFDCVVCLFAWLIFHICLLPSFFAG